MFHLPYGEPQVQSGREKVLEVLALWKLHSLQFWSNEGVFSWNAFQSRAQDLYQGRLNGKFLSVERFIEKSVTGHKWSA